MTSPLPLSNNETPLDQSVSLMDRLSDAAKAGIEGIVSSLLKEDSAARRREVKVAWRIRLAKVGHQHLNYSSKDYTWSTPDDDDPTLPRYMDAFNIVSPHIRSFVTILSQNPPGVNFPADDLNSNVDITAAAYAENERHVVDRLVHMKTRQMEIADSYCTDGRTISWVRLGADGTLKDTTHGVLESKVPFLADCSRWQYVILSSERDLYQVKDEYDKFAAKINSSDSGESQYERFARLNALSGRSTDSYLKNLVTEHNAWVKPSRYRKAADAVRDELRQVLPRGLRAVVMGGVLVDVYDEVFELGDSQPQTLVVSWPVQGQGQVRVSMLHDIIPVQGAVNDLFNQERENAEYGIPGGWLDSNAVDPEAMVEQKSSPGTWHFMSPPAGKNVDQCFSQEQPSQLSVGAAAFRESLIAFGDLTTGDSASLRGEVDPQSGGVFATEKLITDKAKGQLSMAWAALQWHMAKKYAIAVPLSASTSNGERSVAGPSGQSSYDPRLILDGRFGCVPSSDSSFPETMADKRASLQMVLTQLADPEITKQPDNMKLIKQYSGLNDLVVPSAESRDKQLREIEQLLQESPIPNKDDPQWQQMAMQAAQQGLPAPPPPMLPSVQVDAEWDAHAPELAKLTEWLSSPARYEQERKGNMQGIANVKLHGKQHKDAIAAANQPTLPKPINVTVSMPITDPATQAKILQMNGIDADPETLTAAQVPAAQEQAARTQNQAAGAQHKAVLAAKEVVAPVLPGTAAVPPDEAGKEKK